jgi:hypothetical protein
MTIETAPLPTSLDPLVLDLVEWVARTPRPLADVLDAWRTSCPRLTVWEDAVDRGFVVREVTGDDGVKVRATEAGLAFLRENGRAMSQL